MLQTKLKALRDLAGLSQREFSLLAGLAESHVGLIEQGHVTAPDVKTLIALAGVVGCSLDYLIADVGTAPDQDAVIAAVEAARAARREREDAPEPPTKSAPVQNPEKQGAA